VLLFTCLIADITIFKRFSTTLFTTKEMSPFFASSVTRGVICNICLNFDQFFQYYQSLTETVFFGNLCDQIR